MQNTSFDAGQLLFGIGGAGVLILVVVLIVAILILKGCALWYAARRGQKAWFVVLLVVNTIGILELIYLIGVAKVWPKRKGESVPPNQPNPTPPAA